MYATLNPRQFQYLQNCFAITVIILGAGLFPVAMHAEADANWASYLGDSASSQYSILSQINRSNVDRLELAWTYHAGDVRKNNRSQIQCNPLVIDGVLYGTTPQLKLIALDATDGREKWRFDPFDGRESTGNNRGVVYWSDGSSKRILYSVSNFLYAIDAQSGNPIAGFGENGRVNLKIGLGRDVTKLSLTATTPGVLYGDLLILGMRLGEGPAPAAPGHIRAYDVRSGELVWRFNTIPSPGEFGHDTWPPEAWMHIGGANVWTGFALDGERGLVFCPTGAAAFDFWGGNRHGQNLFSNCLIALHADTGKRAWHYQFVHHDLWDRDLPTPPNLVTVRHDGQTIDAVAQATKSGHVFVFNRETGEPLFPIEEIPVPVSNLQGESAWPTQPVPLKPAPFARQLFGFDEITDISKESRREVLNRFVKLQPHTPFAPPSTEGTIIFPGFDGGAEWGGAATDPNGIFYVNANEMPWVLTMVRSKESNDTGGSADGSAIYAQICAACHGPDMKGNAPQNVPPLTGLGERLKEPEIRAVLESGKGVMPSFAFLNSSQKTAVTGFLLNRAPSETDSTSASKSPANESQSVLETIPYSHTGYNRWLDSKGYPAVRPPWGTLNAIDLNTGEYKWTVTLGEFPELTAKGVPPTGTENYGGPVVTAGGLLFIAASKDQHIRAFDSETGNELWKYKLPAGGYATPATYSVAGTQYVVIACGGGKMGTHSGDAYVAFRLR